ncbi:MAG: response regulator transcription factor [Pseudomonadales bacterium]|nr:response regulator transcription factor [Pseudomonadales bacterium]
MSLANLLIIDNDRSLNDWLTTQLCKCGFHVEQHFDGERGLICAVQKKFDLILLDTQVPNRDGFTVLKHLVDNTNIPVVMLTANGVDRERIQGLSIGAEDCVSKPFDSEELILRINAILARTGAILNPHRIQFEIDSAGLKLNKRTQSTCYSNQEIALTPIQFKLLWVLVSNPNETLSKAYLYQTVLEREFSLYDRSLDMHMSRVRKKLVMAGIPKDRLKTVHGAGYCFS